MEFSLLSSDVDNGNKNPNNPFILKFKLQESDEESRNDVIFVYEASTSLLMNTSSRSINHICC